MRISPELILTAGLPRIRRGACLLIGLLAGVSVFAQNEAKPSSQTESLRTTVTAWVEMMQKVQEDQARWTRERQVLESNKEGLEQEIVGLEEAIASAQARVDSTGREEQEQLAQKREYDSAREVLAGALTEAETEARRVIPLIPGYFLKENTKLAAAVEALRKTADFTDGEKAGNLGNRLNAITLVLSEMEKIQAQTWVVEEQREVDGNEKVVDTIYFGLSIAFAADRQKTIALRGTSSESGWQFVPLPGGDAAARIQALIAVAKLEGEIKFVEVPLEVR